MNESRLTVNTQHKIQQVYKGLGCGILKRFMRHLDIYLVVILSLIFF